VPAVYERCVCCVSVGVCVCVLVVCASVDVGRGKEGMNGGVSGGESVCV